MSRLNQQVAIITGASSGIGEATAVALAGRGCRVVLAARRVDRLEAVRQRIAAGADVGNGNGNGGTNVLIQPCDVSQRADVQRLAEAAIKMFGRIDILINNAGIMPLAEMAKCRFDDWDQIIDINVKGALNAIGSVLPTMLEQKTGHIVNVGSVAGRHVFPNAAVYCGSKFALHAISEGLRSELAVRGQQDGNRIRVTVLAPGVVETELRDSITDPDAAKGAAAYYASIADPLVAEDMADAILHCLEAPPHVNINEILVRPTMQAR